MDQLVAGPAPDNFPSVAMLDWTTGQPNAKYWAVKMLAALGTGRKDFMPTSFGGGNATLDAGAVPPVQADGSLTAEQIAGFVARGFINLPPEHLGMPAEHHENVYANHRAGREAFGIAGQAYGSHARDNVFNHMDANPGVLQVLTCPSLVAAVGSLLGPDWAIVPYANSTIRCAPHILTRAASRAVSRLMRRAS